jgi:hypothetical protein
MNDLSSILRAAGISHPLEPLEGYEPIHTLITPGNAAFPMWKKLRSLTPRTAHFPVILGPPDDARDILADALAMDPAPPAETLAFAQKINIDQWLERKRALDADLYDDLEEGPWPAALAAPSPNFSLPFDVLTHQPHPAVLLALVPAANSWELPAHLRFGNYNDCPEAAVHIAFARTWHEKFGSEIVCLSHDILETTVPRPPTTREAALILARQQFMYCPDIVDQGVETISNLAATLLNSDKWYFWWD